MPSPNYLIGQIANSPTLSKSTASALDAVVKPLLLGSHPDRNSGSTAQERTVAVLQARTLLKAAIVEAAGSNSASKSAPKKASIPARK